MTSVRRSRLTLLSAELFGTVWANSFRSARSCVSSSVMGCIIIFALSFAVINLIVDLIYGFIDPRIKAQYKYGGENSNEQCFCKKCKCTC